MDFSVESKCLKIPNNRYQTCPALMSDARTFTDWRSSCYVNSLLQSKNGIQSSEEYRRFLITNGNRILSETNRYYNHKLGCQ